MIESPAAFFQMPAIAAASPRLAAMNIGGEDFALETGMEPSEETLLMPKQQMIFAARAAGIMPLGFIDSIAAFGDREAFARMVRRSRQFGFMGAGCIHPGQVPIVNEQYSPSAGGSGLRDAHRAGGCRARGRRPRLVVARRQDDRRARRRPRAAPARTSRGDCRERSANETGVAATHAFAPRGDGQLNLSASGCSSILALSMPGTFDRAAASMNFPCAVR